MSAREASSSDSRKTLASLRVRAWVESRKCCAIVTVSDAFASDIVTNCHLIKGGSILYDDILTMEDDNA
jgi:hypothetical protein